MRPFDAMRLRSSGGGGGGGGFATRRLQLHGEGSNGGTTFTDSSLNNFSPLSSTGCTTSTTEKKFGSSSILVNTTGSLQYATDAQFDIATADFVVRCFVRFTDTGVRRFIAGKSNSGGSNTTISFCLERTAADKIRGFCCQGASAIGDIVSSSSVTSGVWYYIAYGREIPGAGTTYRLFIDAVAEGTSVPGQRDSINNSGANFAVGRLGEFTGASMNGYIDEFQYVIGEYIDIAAEGVPSGPFPDS